MVAVFDNDPAKIGQPIGGLRVQPMEKMCETVAVRHAEIGILAIPAESAQEVADELAACGVRGILNYPPINLAMPDDVHVAYIDPVASLQSMTFYL
jgi:redox-sensing transcriptional repressor